MNVKPGTDNKKIPLKKVINITNSSVTVSESVAMFVYNRIEDTFLLAKHSSSD